MNVSGRIFLNSRKDVHRWKDVKTKFLGDVEELTFLINISQLADDF